jgi:hypothetical protein
MFKTKLEAVKELSGYDHSFLTPKFVALICEPFGFDPKEFIYKAQDTRSEFKGLTILAGKEGDWWDGADADQFAAGLCNKLGVKYFEKYGRGSRLRECCEALEKFLSE